MFADLPDIIETFGLAGCIRCGACTKACPCSRNGGIMPDSMVASVIEGNEVENVWACLLCHRCSTVCPKDVDVAGMITELRYRSASAGNAPERFKRLSAVMIKSGRTIPSNSRVDTQREELGLEKIKDDDRSMRELGKIMSRTGFSYE